MDKNVGERFHDALVLRLAKYLKKRFYQQIRALADGYLPPPPLHVRGQDFTPDVTMVDKRQQFYLFEVETQEGLRAQGCETKWSAFAEYAAGSGSKFYVAVPQGVGTAAGERLRDLRLGAKVWEI